MMQVASEEADTDEIHENNALKMMELWMRQEDIKGEIENLENPLIRNLVIYGKSMKFCKQKDRNKDLAWW
jgi:hypothetical protein